MDKSEFLKLASLAHISFTKAEAKRYMQEMDEIIKFMDVIVNSDIKNTDCDDVGIDFKSLREDEVKESLPADEILKNADSENGYFKVRRCRK